MHRLSVRLLRLGLSAVIAPLALVLIVAAPAHADPSGSGGCDPKLGTCGVGVGGGGSGGGGSGGGGPSAGCQNTDPSDGGCNPCPPGAAYGAQPPAVSAVCAAYLRNGFCAATLNDALGGLKVQSVARLTPGQTALVNKDLQAQGCTPVVTPASLAQRAYRSIRFPRPSGGRTPSTSLSYQGLPFTYVNLWTFFFTTPGTWRTLSATASAAGMSATVTARPVRLLFDPGDGSSPVSCPGPGRAWSAADGNGPPTDGACAYRYARVTPEPITSTQSIVWQITWVGTGNSGGQIPSLSTSTSGQLRVLQVQVVNR